MGCSLRESSSQLANQQVKIAAKCLGIILEPNQGERFGQPILFGEDNRPIAIGPDEVIRKLTFMPVSD